MNPYKRPEMELDPAKKPGQIVSPIVHPDTVYGGARPGGKAYTPADYLSRLEEDFSPYATVNS